VRALSTQQHGGRPYIHWEISPKIPPKIPTTIQNLTSEDEFRGVVREDADVDDGWVLPLLPGRRSGAMELPVAQGKLVASTIISVRAHGFNPWQQSIPILFSLKPT
jgi:hypothetical protein